MIDKNQPSAGRFKVKVTRDGPYLLSGRIPLAEQIIGTDTEGYCYEWREGNKYLAQETYALCRCGRSENKPFCDGTHVKAGFNGTETASHESYVAQAERLHGPELDLTDAEALCSYARFCDRAGGIWNLVGRSDNQEAKRVAIQEAGNCPSGRLVVWDKEGMAIEPQFEPSIGLVADPQIGKRGPIWVRGHIPVESADGTAYEIRNRVTLCRCGRSYNKPFCDGSHAQP
jgi:CDGSH-type Zn-finger protein